MDIERLKELKDYLRVANELSDNIIANARLKADIAERDVCRIADNLVEMERINRMGDMADEIKQLKAKLDEVRAECLKPIMITSDVFGGGVAAGHNILKQAVLAIIKDGEDK